MRNLSKFIANFYYVDEKLECKCFDAVFPERYNTDWRLNFKRILTDWMNDDNHRIIAIDLDDCDAIIIKAPILTDQSRLYKIYYDFESFEKDKPFITTHSYKGLSQFILSFLLSKYDEVKKDAQWTIPIHFHIDPKDPSNNTSSIGEAINKEDEK